MKIRDLALIKGELGGAKAERGQNSMTFRILGRALELFQGWAPKLRFASRLKVQAYCLRFGELASLGSLIDTG